MNVAPSQNRYVAGLLVAAMALPGWMGKVEAAGGGSRRAPPTAGVPWGGVAGRARVAEADRPPPTLVDKVLDQILVERDLEAARSILVEALAPALSKADNPGWVSRIYALLGTVEVYRGDASRAARYFWRAVVLNPNVQLEPQLGDAPRTVLEQVRARWQSSPRNAGMRFSGMPAGVDLYVDGRRRDAPGTVRLKPGDHLVQVDSTLGVIARKWVAVASGPPVDDPAPIPSVLQSLGRGKALRILSDDELLEAFERASADAKVVTGTVADLMGRVDRALKAQRLERAACFQQHLQDAGRLAEEVEGFAGRLETAAKANDGDEVLHLVKMTDLAATRASDNLSDADACFDIIDPSSPPEVRVIASPPQAPEALAVEAGAVPSAWGRTVFAPSIPGDALQFNMLRPDDTGFATTAEEIATSGRRTYPPTRSTRVAPGTSPPAPGAMWWYAGVWADVVVDTNPERRPSMAGVDDGGEGEGDPSADGATVDGAGSPEAVMALSPAFVVGGRAWHAGVRYPLRIGTRRVIGSDLEAVAQAALTSRTGRTGTGRLLVTRDTFSPLPLGGQFGLFERTAVGGAVRVGVLPPGALHIEGYGETGMETHRLRDAATLLALGTVRAGVDAGWQWLPRSTLFASVGAAAGRLNERPSAGSARFAAVEHRRFASHLSIGVSGAFFTHFGLTGWVGPQFTTAMAGEAPRDKLAGEDSITGGVALRYVRGPFRVWVQGGREVTQEVFADLRVAERAEVGFSAGREGWLQGDIRCHVGRARFFLAGDPTAPPVMVPGGWWPVQRFLGGRVTVRIRLQGAVRQVELRAVYVPEYRWGVPVVIGATNPSSAGRVVVHQGFAGIYAPF